MNPALLSPAPAPTPALLPLGVALCGSAAFGAAAALGHGLPALARGAVCAPVLFLGGAALAVPPLYLATALSGGRSSAAEILARVTTALHQVGLALLGLAAPAAYFSITLRTGHAAQLLLLAASVLGAAGVLGVTRATLDHERAPAAQHAATIWMGFALLLGARLLFTLRHAAGLGV